MPSEYRFLRFEIVGLSTIVFLSIGILPLIRVEAITETIENVSMSLSVVASLFLFSLPLGYWEHQLVVNVYRSENKIRPAHLLLEEMIPAIHSKSSNESKDFYNALNALEKNALLTSLLDLCIYSKKSAVSQNISERVSDRWSHFYARKAVGKYAPTVAIVLWGVFLVIGYFIWPNSFAFEWYRILISIAVWVFVFATSVLLIDKYSNKIWSEICFVENEIILSNEVENKELIGKVVKRLAEHPEYFHRMKK